VYVFVYVCMYVCMYVREDRDVTSYVCIYVCIYVCKRRLRCHVLGAHGMCMQVCVYVYGCTYVCKSMVCDNHLKIVCIHSCIHTYVHTHYIQLKLISDGVLLAKQKNRKRHVERPHTRAYT
jgi:hypothetical protein